MNRLALMAVVAAASSAAVLAAETEGNAWPFAILRIYGNGESNDGFLRQVAAAQERHPGFLPALHCALQCGVRRGTKGSEFIDRVALL